MALSSVEVAWRAVVAKGLASYQANVAANEAERTRSDGLYEKSRKLSRQNFIKEAAKETPRAIQR